MPLIICEKNIAAKRIAALLSKKTAETIKIDGVPVYTYIHNGEDCSVVGLRGHIFNLDYPKKYNVWEAIDPRELVWVKPELVSQDKFIVNALKTLAEKDEAAIIATDYDREGELIGVEALKAIEQHNPKIHAKRARFSALTEGEVLHAFEELDEIDYHLSAAAEARQRIDLAWGAALTRFISLSADQVGKDFLSVGRVQSPTLAIIVDREREIKNFKPTPYWVIKATLSKDEHTDFSAKHQKDRFKTLKAAETAYQNAKECSEAKITDIRKRKTTEKPPTPFNTTEFLQAANRIGFSAARAMRIAEDLYTEGLISYPRTDNTHYPESLNLREILEAFAAGVDADHDYDPGSGSASASASGTETDLVEAARELLTLKKLEPTHGKRQATDHPPIHPTALAIKSDLSADRWKIYEHIVRRFFATLAPPAKAERLTVKLDLNTEPFTTSGYRVIEPGWRKYYSYFAAPERKLPDLKKGELVTVKAVELTAKKTKPPKRYSQGQLIQEMDRLGLGTKSTRHEIIQKLYLRGYIESSPPQPSLAGFAVTDTLEKYVRLITQAKMTAQLEHDMDKIADGELSDENVVQESQEMLDKIFKVLEKNRAKIGEAVKEALLEQNIVGMCSRCGRDMIAARSRWGKRFVRCTRYPLCRNSYPLPQSGKIQATGYNCGRCRAPIIKLTTKRRKTWEICVNIDCPEMKDYFKQYKKRPKK